MKVRERNGKKVLCIVACVLVCALVIATLVACTPKKDPFDAYQVLLKRDYTVSINSNMPEAEGLLGVEMTVIAQKDDDAVIIFYFQDTSAAETACVEQKDVLFQRKKVLIIMGVKENKILTVRYGNIVCIGSLAAINASK